MRTARLWAAAILCVNGAISTARPAETVSHISPPDSPAVARPAETMSAPEAETVVVVARHSGPALWRVTRGNSEVWILGSVAPMPKDLQWDARDIGTLLQGARVLLLPPRAEIGLLEGLWFAVSELGTLEQPDGVTLENSLDEPLRERFLAARTRAHRDASRYAKYLPAIAALRIEIDSRDPAGLTMDEPEGTIGKLASRAGVPIKPIAVYRFMDVVHDVPSMSMTVQRTCLEDALDDIDAEAAHATAASEAWAHGDVKGAAASSPENKLETCLRQSAAFNGMYNRAIADTVSAIVDALSSPGKAVVIVPMGSLLRKGGVLDRLRTGGGQTVMGPP